MIKTKIYDVFAPEKNSKIATLFLCAAFSNYFSSTTGTVDYEVFYSSTQCTEPVPKLQLAGAEAHLVEKLGIMSLNNVSHHLRRINLRDLFCFYLL